MSLDQGRRIAGDPRDPARAIKALLAASRLTNEELAAHLGISRQALSTKLNFTRPFRKTEIMAVAQLMNQDFDALSRGDVSLRDMPRDVIFARFFFDPAA